MFIERNPWIVVVGSVLTAATLYIVVVLTHQMDQSDVLGNWFMHATVFGSFAVIALIVYRSLRRSRSPAVMDEARPKQG